MAAKMFEAAKMSGAGKVAEEAARQEAEETAAKPTTHCVCWRGAHGKSVQILGTPNTGVGKLPNTSVGKLTGSFPTLLLGDNPTIYK